MFPAPTEEHASVSIELPRQKTVQTFPRVLVGLGPVEAFLEYNEGSFDFKFNVLDDLLR